MDSTARRRLVPGFTMIELLVVVGIIVLLVAISIAVGFKVTGSGKLRQTEQALRVLEQSLTEYIAAAGTNPRPWVRDPRSTQSNIFVQPVIDGRNGADEEFINSVGLYILQCREYPSVAAVFNTLDAKIFREYDGDAAGNESNPNSQMPLPTVLDGWGNPIRYVHPTFGGLIPDSNNHGFVNIDTVIKTPVIIEGQPRSFGIDQVRRHADEGDADGGIPPGNRPYFYSAGPDGLPETTDDNVYINTPSFSRIQ